MQLAAKACFSPGAAALVFQKLGAAEQQQGVQIPKMLRTHPLSKVRPPHLSALTTRCCATELTTSLRVV